MTHEINETNEHITEETLFTYLDGEQDAATQAALERHLAGCADCQARLDQQVALFGRIDTLR